MQHSPCSLGRDAAGTVRGAGRGGEWSWDLRPWAQGYRSRARGGSQDAPTFTGDAYCTGGQGDPDAPSLRLAWHSGLEGTRVGDLGRRTLTCYLTWHQVSREEGAQPTWGVRGADPAPLIGDCARRCARPAASAPLLPPRSSRLLHAPARSERRGQLTGGAGPRGRGQSSSPPTCDEPRPICPTALRVRRWPRRLEALILPGTFFFGAWGL